MNDIIFGELDAHKAAISMSVAQEARRGEVRSWGMFLNRAGLVHRHGEKLGCDRSWLNFCYEDVPRGYGLNRQPTELLHNSLVAAPSPITVNAGGGRRPTGS